MAPPSAIEVEGIRDTEGIPQKSSFETNGNNSFAARRAKAGKFNGGTAAYTSSDFYKDPEATARLPKAKKWDRMSSLIHTRETSSLAYC